MASSSTAQSTPSKESIANLISDRFNYLYEKYGEPPSYALTSDAKVVKEALETYGMFISEDIPSDTYSFNGKAIAEDMYKFIYDTITPSFDNPIFVEDLKTINKKYPNITGYESYIAALSERWNSASGFGNSNFRFFYTQFTTKPIVFKIGDQNIEFTRCPIHRHNLRLLQRIPGAWELLKSMYPRTNPMVSWDSQKIRFEPKASKSTASSLTIRHRDIYVYEGKELDRLQAMIILENVREVPPISLGYVLFSNDSKIRNLLKTFFGKESHRFGNISDPLLNPIFDRMWRSTKNSFVIWNQSTIHYEGIAEDIEGYPHIRRLVSTDVKNPLYRKSLQEFNFRAVIGTHTPIDLSQKELKQLAAVSEMGWIPEIYTSDRKNNVGTSVNYNVVNRKTTQFKKPRELKSSEAHFYEITKKENLITLFNDLDIASVYKEMYGIYDEKVLKVSTSYNISVQLAEVCIKSTMKMTDTTREQVLDIILV